MPSHAASGRPLAARRATVVTSAAAGGAPAPAPAGGAARRVRLGTSDLAVSRCCLGTMTWGVQNTEAEAHEQLSWAFDEAGINFLDTAEIYPVPPNQEKAGTTDRYIATWLKTRRRDDVVVATKVAGFGNAYLRPALGPTRVNAAHVAASVDASLARLGVDHIDLLQIHWPDRYVGGMFGAPPYSTDNERPDDVPFEEQLRALEAVVKAGKVRYVGVSNETTYGVMRFVAAAEAAGLPRIQTIQNAYSLLVRTPFETDLAEACAPRQANVALLAYSPLAGGALSGKYIGADPAAPGLKNARFNLFEGYMARYNQSRAREAVAEYAAVAARAGLSPAALALAWCAQRWFVASTIIGATSMEQLRANVAAFDVPPLGAEALEGVNAVYARHKDPAMR